MQAMLNLAVLASPILLMFLALILEKFMSKNG
jgi:hypothetical protein